LSCVQGDIRVEVERLKKYNDELRIQHRHFFCISVSERNTYAGVLARAENARDVSWSHTR